MTELCKDFIYLDNAATTAQSKRVTDAMTDAADAYFFNASAMYRPALDVTIKIAEARDDLSDALHASGGDIYFTSGGTESNNMALFGARKRKGGRIIVGQGEHDSVYMPANELKNQGYSVDLAPIGTDGTVIPERFAELLGDEVCLVSIMHASNETGAINDIARLVKLTRKAAPKALFHSDGVQAFGKTPVNLKALDVDMYSASAHKLHGPKGIGLLYVKRGASVKPLLFGGGQERGMRSGTESYPLIRGFQEACRLDIAAESAHVCQYRQRLLAALNERIEGLKVITPLENSVPNILTVAFDGVRGEVLLHALEEYGIYVGTGSACASHHESRFKRAYGLDERHIDGVIRISMSATNRLEEIDYVADSFAKSVAKLKI